MSQDNVEKLVLIFENYTTFKTVSGSKYTGRL